MIVQPNLLHQPGIDPAAVHHLLSNVNLPKALEKGQRGHVKPLPALLSVAVSVEACVKDGEEAEDAGGQVAVHLLLALPAA